MPRFLVLEQRQLPAFCYWQYHNKQKESKNVSIDDVTIRCKCTSLLGDGTHLVLQCRATAKGMLSEGGTMISATTTYPNES